MQKCTLPPLSSEEDRGFLSTTMRCFSDSNKLLLVFIFGVNNQNPFLLIQSEKTKKDIAALSLEYVPKLLWGAHFSGEEQVIAFITKNVIHLIDHWNGTITSDELLKKIVE